MQTVKNLDINLNYDITPYFALSLFCLFAQSLDPIQINYFINVKYVYAKPCLILKKYAQRQTMNITFENLVH